MVKLILPNSAPPGQESQKCLENKCTALVTSRRREVMKSDREVTKAQVLRDIFGSPGQVEPSWEK